MNAKTLFIIGGIGAVLVVIYLLFRQSSANAAAAQAALTPTSGVAGDIGTALNLIGQAPGVISGLSSAFSSSGGSNEPGLETSGNGYLNEPGLIDDSSTDLNEPDLSEEEYA
jgi:hypothetical protein